jgi:hypothetical protein
MHHCSQHCAATPLCLQALALISWMFRCVALLLVLAGKPPRPPQG